MKEFAKRLGIDTTSTKQKSLEFEDEIIVPVVNKTNQLQVVTPNRAIVSVEDPTPAQQDFILARKTLRDLVKKSNDTLDDLLDLAKDQESARVYEVAATFIKTMADISKDLIDIHVDKTKPKAAEKSQEPDTNNFQVEKAVFVGNPQELLAHIRGE